MKNRNSGSAFRAPDAVFLFSISRIDAPEPLRSKAMSQAETPDKKPIDPSRPLSRKQFCELEGISMSTYHRLKREGRGPTERCFPGMYLAQIMPAAHRQWRIDIDKWNRSKAAKLERARRVDASRKAAESEHHVSKVRKAATAKKRR
jgi:hypothetical protein